MHGRPVADGRRAARRTRSACRHRMRTARWRGRNWSARDAESFGCDDVTTADSKSGTEVCGQDRRFGTTLSVANLAVRLRRGEGATGHYASLLEVRNVSTARCILSGYPLRVTVSEPRRPPVIAKRGGFFDESFPSSRPMNTGGMTTLVIETDTYCNARPTGGPPGPFYHHVSVELNDGVLNASTPCTRGLDVGFGAFATKFGRWQ
jgi:hypothetical protein